MCNSTFFFLDRLSKLGSKSTSTVSKEPNLLRSFIRSFDPFGNLFTCVFALSLLLVAAFLCKVILVCVVACGLICFLLQFSWVGVVLDLVEKLAFGNSREKSSERRE